jgi:hypothetical protein
VRAIKESADLLSPSDIDKSLVFPFFIAGFMAKDIGDYQLFRKRLDVHKVVSNSVSILMLMEVVWTKMDDYSSAAAAIDMTEAPTVDWRDLMKDLGMEFLLVQWSTLPCYNRGSVVYAIQIEPRFHLS